METIELSKAGEKVIVTAGGADEAFWRDKGYTDGSEPAPRPKRRVRRSSAENEDGA